MDEIFTAGIRPGGLTAGREIRILICYILSEMAEPMSMDEMTEAVLSDGAANYFEFADALSELCESGAVLVSKTDAGLSEYTASEKGKSVAATLQNDLPPAVRERSLTSAKAILQRRRLEKENRVSITKTEDGYKLRVRVTDIGTDLMELSLFMPTREQAMAAKEHFLSDPSGVYAGVLSLLAGEF